MCIFWGGGGGVKESVHRIRIARHAAAGSPNAPCTAASLAEDAPRCWTVVADCLTAAIARKASSMMARGRSDSFNLLQAVSACACSSIAHIAAGQASLAERRARGVFADPAAQVRPREGIAPVCASCAPVPLSIYTPTSPRQSGSRVGSRCSTLLRPSRSLELTRLGASPLAEPAAHSTHSTRPLSPAATQRPPPPGLRPLMRAAGGQCRRPHSPPRWS